MILAVNGLATWQLLVVLSALTVVGIVAGLIFGLIGGDDGWD